MPESRAEDPRYASLAHHLEALASPTRLELLHALRMPQALHEIHVTPSLSREQENPERPLSRQAVTRHLDYLMEVGLVARVKGDAAKRGDLFVLNHERLFAVVDEIRNLGRLRPLGSEAAPPGATMARHGGGVTRLPDPPRLLVAYGRDDGSAYPLHGPAGTKWRIGRAAACEIRLDYDAYLSGTNSIVERTAAGFVVHDVVQSKNGTWVNWDRLAPGTSRALQPGDAVMAGRSVLVFQAPAKA